MNLARKAMLTASTLTLGAITHADPALDQFVTFSGFGTLGAVYSSYKQADFVGSVVQLNGAGHSGSWSVTPDSDLGGQANLSLTDALSGVVQVLSRDDASGNFKPTVEWANIKYAFTPDLAVRVGRTVLPTYERSDVQNVGYVLPWVRLPIEISYTDTAEHSDGLDVLYRVNTGTITHNLEIQWGRTLEDLPGAAFTATHADILVLSDSLRQGDTSAHVAYQTYGHTDIPAVRTQIVNGGLTYDPGSWFLTADGAYTRDGFFGDFFAWYISGCVRFGRFAPYMMYSSTRALSVGTSGLKSLGNEHTVATGVRWDFARNFDAKLQLQQVIIDSLDDPASFANIQPGARVGDKADVLSLALDFVF